MDKVTEMVEKAAAAKAWLAARQAKRSEAEAKIIAVLNTLRDIRDDLKADAKAAEQEQGELDDYFRSLMRYVESQPESPEQDATLSAMEDVSCYGGSTVDTYNFDATLSMLEKAIGEVDECCFDNFERAEKRTVAYLDAALKGLPSAE